MKAECQTDKVKQIPLEIRTKDVGRAEGREVILRQYSDLLEGATKAAKEVAVVSALPRLDQYGTGLRRFY